jgi:SH3-like domain-containing protein
VKQISVSIILGMILVISQTHAHALCVKVTDANLRSGPGTKHEKTWEVFKYMPFKRLLRRGDWYKVQDVDGDYHWIYRKLVTDAFDCAVVKREKANMRTGPGTQYRITTDSPMLKYDSFRVLKRSGKWVQVLDEFGDKGWIFRKLLWIY